MFQVRWFSGGILYSAAMVLVVACGQGSTDTPGSSNESIQQPFKHKARAGKNKPRQHAHAPRHGRHGRHGGWHRGPGRGNDAGTGGNGSATGGSTGNGGPASGGMYAGGGTGRGGSTSYGGSMSTGGYYVEPSVCGNGWPEGYESCDDGNTEPADGCSADCQIEPGWSCPEYGVPCHEVVCGDGRTDWWQFVTEDGYLEDRWEECDDGNTVDGDGCTSQCTPEVGYYCEAPGEPCREVACGDGLADPYVISVGSNGTLWAYEHCDDGNTDSNDGCSAACMPELGFMCYSPGEPCKAVVCGDGSQENYVAEVEVIGSDGAAGATGAPSGQAGAPNGTGGAPGTGGIQATGGFGTGGSTGATTDGVVIRYGWEQCDDGNITDADGCSATCEIESGYVCSTPGQACHQPACGDGLQDSYLIPGTGGAAGATGTATGGAAGATGTGTGGAYGGRGGRGGMTGTGGSDGTWVWEECDDGNTVDSDGCSATCTLEPGYVCSEPGQACRQPACGDGFQDSYFIPGTGGAAGAPETGTGGVYGRGGATGTGGAGAGYYVWESCDDGNIDSGDGCGAACELESGWVCPNPGQPCVASVCGDGIEDYNTEECDDGNTVDGDGCSAVCTYEW